MAKEVGSGGAGSHPNRVRRRSALPFSARISALPFLHAGLFQSTTGYQIPFQPLIVCWFLNQIPHLGLIKLTNYPQAPPHPTFLSSVHQEILLQLNHCGVWKDQTGFYFIAATILLCDLVYATFSLQTSFSTLWYYLVELPTTANRPLYKYPRKDHL